jgi:hypothetical protein
LWLLFSCAVYADETSVDFEVNLVERVPLIGVMPGPSKVSLMLTTYVEHGRIYKSGGFTLDMGPWSFTVPQYLARNIYAQLPSDLRVSFY